MIIRDFQAVDIFNLSVQDRQEGLRHLVSMDLAKSLEGFESYTAVDGDRILGCGGVVTVWPGRNQAWAYLAKDLGHHMIPLTRTVKRFLDACPGRVEATASWDTGCRWLGILGFKLETPEPMEGYMPDGTSAYLYARVT